MGIVKIALLTSTVLYMAAVSAMRLRRKRQRLTIFLNRI
jgi:hypothetical protein